jgi:N utilization substance protein B
MLNRRHIRIKVLQALYAAIQSEELDIFQGQSKLMEKFDSIYDLAIYQISFILEIRDYAEIKLGEAQKKNYPTEDELNPNTKFINNGLLRQIADNKDYSRRMEKLAVNWSTEPDMLRNVYQKVIQSVWYKDYMANNESAYKSDKEFVINIFENVVLPHESLYAFLKKKVSIGPMIIIWLLK